MVMITAFWARGYRSLRDLRLDTDRPYNVFYGRNGAGKSNILSGIRAVFDLAAHWAYYAHMAKEPVGRAKTWVDDDRCRLEETLETRLGSRCERRSRSLPC